MRMYQLALTSPRGTPGRELALRRGDPDRRSSATSLDALGTDPVRSDAVVAVRALTRRTQKYPFMSRPTHSGTRAPGAESNSGK